MYDNAELLSNHFSEENLEKHVKVSQGMIEIDDWVKTLPDELVDLGILCTIKALNKLRYTRLDSIETFLKAFYDKFHEMQISGEVDELDQMRKIKDGIFATNS